VRAPAGERDRRLRFEIADETQAAGSGQPVQAWKLVREVWGSKRDLSGSELFRAQQLVAKVSTEFEILYPDWAPFPIANADESMRLTVVGEEAKVYDITLVLEVGRRDGLRIMAWARPEEQAAA
jgi:SPP1 family predicted phage head-tail adaptor